MKNSMLFFAALALAGLIGTALIAKVLLSRVAAPNATAVERGPAGEPEPSKMGWPE